MIVFTTPIDATRLHMAYNNHIVRFYGNAGEPMYCDITGLNLSIRLYPNPAGQFFCNFKSYISALINRRGFADNTDPIIDSSEPSSFIYNFTQGTFLQMALTFKITYADSPPDYAGHVVSWLAGVEQIGSSMPLAVHNRYVLSPFRKLSGNSYFLKYWQGYPFDMQVYTSGITLRLYNETNLLSAQFSVLGYGDRIFFSDGRTDETLEDLLPLVEGFNKLRLMSSPSGSVTDKYILLEKVPYKCGVYLKWLNKYGGYSYWLFENAYTLDRSTKYTGEIDRDTVNLDDAYTRTVQLGKESQDTMRIIADLLTEDERGIVEGILDSPKIYLFTGQPYARSSRKDWIEVSLKTTGARLKNAKQPLTNFTFDLELPQRYTQKL